MIRRADAPAGVLLALFAWLTLAGGALAAPKFPPLTGRVVDQANLLAPDVEQQLTAQLEGLEQQTGRQLVVATVPSLQGYEIEDFGYQLGRSWGIGDQARDDGVILLVAPNERKVRIEVGYGLEPVLTDALSSVIIQSRILPAFREGRMEQGVVAGAQAIVQQLSLPDDQAKAQVAAAQPVQSESEGGAIQAVVVMFVIFFIVSRLFGGRRRGRRGSSALWMLPFILSSGGRGGGGRGGGGWGGGGGGGGGWGGGGGGSFGGGGSSGGW